MLSVENARGDLYDAIEEAVVYKEARSAQYLLESIEHYVSARLEQVQEDVKEATIAEVQ